MPIYEYQCAKCGDFEVSQRITDQPLKRCPTCRGKVKKLISNTSFQLKGSGWYQTDYGSKKSEAKEKSTSSEATAGGKGDSSSKSESAGTSESTGKSESTGTSESSGKTKSKKDTAAQAA